MNPKVSLLEQRHAVRSFSEEAIPQNIVNSLKAEVTMTNTHEQGMKFQLFFNDPDPLKGFSRAYGMFMNPANFLAAVIDTATPDAYERAGYFAEKFAIKAVSLGLGTCFVSGTYDRSKVRAQLRAGEKLIFIVIFGFPMEKKRPVASLMSMLTHHKTMDPEDFFDPASMALREEREFPELSDGLAGVACAPSAMNKRPVRVFLDDNGRLCAKVPENSPAMLIDLGIAKFNYNYATDTLCEWGNGAPLES